MVARRGFPIARSTMSDLLHRTTKPTQSLRRRLVDQVRTRPIAGHAAHFAMQNDGTGKPQNGFVWTVVAAGERRDQDVAYLFADGRKSVTRISTRPAALSPA